MIRRLLRWLPCALVLVLLPSPASAATPGLNVSRVDNTGDPYVRDPAIYSGEPSDGAAAWKDVTDSGARTLRTFVQWNALDAGTLDKYARFTQKAAARGLKVELVVTGQPTTMATPAGYARAVGTLAAHLKGGVAAYEVWNEPDDSIFWKDGPQPADYAALLKAAYTSIKAADPSTQVLVGGLVANDYDFVAALYDQGAKGFFDGVAVHTDTSCNTTDPSSYYREADGRIGRYAFTGYREVRATMLAHGDDKPIWMSELGWSSSTAPCAGAPKPSGVSLGQQAEFLSEAYGCLANDPYVVQALWFNLHDFSSSAPSYEQQLGLVNDSFARKPAFAAFTRVGSASAIPCGGVIDDSAPTVSFVGLRDNTPYYSTLPVRVHADDDRGVKDINIFLDGKYIPLHATIRGTSADIATTLWKAGELGFGSHTLVVRARDEARNWGTARMTIVRVGGSVHSVRIPASLRVAYGKVSQRRVSVSGAVRFGGGVRGAGTVEFRFQRRVKGAWKRSNMRHRSVYHSFAFTFAFPKGGHWRIRTRFIPAGPFQRVSVPTRMLVVR